MGAKRNPGAYDCHGKAAPDEPIFTLRGKVPYSDASRPMVYDKLNEAQAVAGAMRQWRAGLNEKATGNSATV